MQKRSPNRATSDRPRAGQAAPGYALRVFPRAINHASRRSTKQARTYTYPQPTISNSASTPGSIFGRRGGSDLNRRRQAMEAPGKRVAMAALVATSFCC